MFLDVVALASGPAIKYPGFVNSATVFQTGCVSSSTSKSPQEFLSPCENPVTAEFIPSPANADNNPTGPKAAPIT